MGEETIISYTRGNPEAFIYTEDTKLMQELYGLEAFTLVREYRQNGKIVAADFKADKKLVVVRKQ